MIIMIIIIATQSHGKDNSRMPYLAIPVFNRPFFFRNFDTARSNLKIELRQRLGNKGQLVNLQVLLIRHQQRHQYKNIVRDKAHTATKSANHEHSSFQLLLAEACFVFISCKTGNLHRTCSCRMNFCIIQILACLEKITTPFSNTKKSWYLFFKILVSLIFLRNLGIFCGKIRPKQDSSSMEV